MKHKLNHTVAKKHKVKGMLVLTSSLYREEKTVLYLADADGD